MTQKTQNHNTELEPMKLIMDICFSVPVTKPSDWRRGSASLGMVDGSECRKAIMKRLASLSDDELEEAVGFVDTADE
tara:strand:+ start:788 stop:1018 length:231 start_codon:yes stop_codon:yes gene_type:complete